MALSLKLPLAKHVPLTAPFAPITHTALNAMTDIITILSKAVVWRSASLARTQFPDLDSAWLALKIAGIVTPQRIALNVHRATLPTIRPA